MAKFNVTLAWSASRTVEVEADTAEQAREQAESEHGVLSLCWHCSQEAEPEDLMFAEVWNEAGELVLDREGNTP